MANAMTVRRIVASLRSGKRVRIPCWIVDSGKPGPQLLVVAAQHGNELQGIETVRRFVERCRRSRMSGRVVAVPFGNLPAIRHGRPHLGLGPEQRYDDARGHNMNRTWPGKRNGNDTERISYALYRAWGDRATHALDLHIWEKDHAPAILARDIPAVCAIVPKLGHRFVSYWGEGKEHTLAGYFCATGRIGLTYEFCGQYDVDEDQVRLGLRVAVNFAKAIGLLRGAPTIGEGPVICSGQRDSVVLRAPCDGLFVRGPHRLCDRIEPGSVLGHVLSDRDLSCVPIRCPKRGWLRHFGPGRPGCDVSLKLLHAYVRRGELLAVVSWPTERGQLQTS